MFQYKTEQWLPISVDEAWNFFSTPLNLSRITPPELDFKILSDVTGKEIFEGMIIDYKVRPLLGIAVRWQTEICKVNRPGFFTDRQLKGPYKVWEHTHYFVEQAGGVMMTDIVDYALPFGIIGTLGHQLIVRKKIKEIFNFRRQTLEKLFKK